jgi:hypothetical protein
MNSPLHTIYIAHCSNFYGFLQYFLNAAWQMCATIFLPVIYNGNFMVYIEAKRFEAFSARSHCYGLFMWIVTLHEQYLIVYGPLDFNPMAEKIFLQILIRRSKQYWWTVHYTLYILRIAVVFTVFFTVLSQCSMTNVCYNIFTSNL